MSDIESRLIFPDLPKSDFLDSFIQKHVDALLKNRPQGYVLDRVEKEERGGKLYLVAHWKPDENATAAEMVADLVRRTKEEMIRHRVQAAYDLLGVPCTKDAPSTQGVTMKSVREAMDKIRKEQAEQPDCFVCLEKDYQYLLKSIEEAGMLSTFPVSNAIDRLYGLEFFRALTEEEGIRIALDQIKQGRRPCLFGDMAKHSGIVRMMASYDPTSLGMTQ